jgi:membrane-bound metal-dependent hydrolase YbcI (DUF457 family)
MPLTPFHFGPALFIGYPLRRRLDLMTFLIAAVITDVRAVLVFFDVLSGPMHGLLHNTYLGSFAVALVLAGSVLLFARRFPAIAHQVSSRPESVSAVVGASVAGTWLHVTLDAFMHVNMQPFYPLAGNPFFNAVSRLDLYVVCLLAFLPFVGYIGLSAIWKRWQYGFACEGWRARIKQRSAIGGVLLVGIGIGVLVTVGVPATIHAFQGIGAAEVTVERLNSTHAVVTWTTEEPTYGLLKTSVSRHCEPTWGNKTPIKRLNDSSFSRTHLIIAPIYDLNESYVARTNVSETGPIKWYQVAAVMVGDNEHISVPIVSRNLSQACR